jgi:ABC-type glycerol-3-phosphate transport system permease component
VSAAPAPTTASQRGSPWLRYLALAGVSVLMLYPLVWLVGATFKSNAEIFTEIGFIPSRLSFEAYVKGDVADTPEGPAAKRRTTRHGDTAISAPPTKT